MKKLLMFLGIIVVFVFIMVIFLNNNDKDNSSEEDKSSNKQTEKKSDLNSKDTTNKEKSSGSNKDTEIAKKNAEEYIEMAYNYNLLQDYENHKNIFSESMLKQLDRYKAKEKGKNKKYGKNDDINRSVNDITIYSDTSEDFPEKVIYTATVTANNTKEKNKMKRDVTGEIDFVEENGKPKIDATKEISSQDSTE